MKKQLKTLLAVLAAVTLTGCMRIKMTVDVTSDAKVSESVTMLFDESMLSEMGTDTAGMRESMKQSFTEGDEKVVVIDAEETIDDKKYVGITAKNLPVDENAIKAVKDGNTITVTIQTAGVTDSLGQETGMSDQDISPEMLKQSGMAMEMIVNMPGEAKCEYGTVNGNSVTFDLFELPSSVKTIEITAKVGGFPWVFVIVGVALAGVAAYFLMNGKKAKQNEAGMSAVAQEFQPDVATPEEAQSVGEMAEKSMILEETDKIAETEAPETHQSGEF
ncbi:MAG: hypothetical protein IKG15_10140 [Solobacterium sp.]|nr:hypothetical protein [Solobacterium sp.]